MLLSSARGSVPLSVPAHTLRATSRGVGRRKLPVSLDTAAHAAISANTNSARRRLPPIVDLLAHHLLDFDLQLAGHQRGQRRYVAQVQLARPRQLHVEHPLEPTGARP